MIRWRGAPRFRGGTGRVCFCRVLSGDREEGLKLFERAGLTDFADPAPVLAKLDEALHRQYQRTNAAIRDGANPHLTIIAKGGFRVTMHAQEEFDSEPLQRTLSQRHFVPLPEILATVNRHCGLLDEFRHWQQAHINMLGEYDFSDEKLQVMSDNHVGRERQPRWPVAPGGGRA